MLSLSGEQILIYSTINLFYCLKTLLIPVCIVAQLRSKDIADDTSAGSAEN